MFLILAILLSTTIYAKKVALLVETASGGLINSDKDIVTMKRLLGNGYEIIVLNQAQATSTRLRTELVNIAKRKLKPEDTFLFYYSGHGGRFKRGDSREADNHDDFLATSNAHCIGTNKVGGVLVDDELNWLYAQIKAKKIIIIDACHSHTMYKGISSNQNSKLFKGCGSVYGLLNRGFSIDSKFLNAKVTNMIHLGASNERESADGTLEGGVFTLALEKVLKEQGNISFGELIEEIRKNIKPIATRLGATGAFTPSIAEVGISQESLFTKDVFVLPKKIQKQQAENTLQQLLNNKLGVINLKVHGDKENFSYLERVILKARIKDTPAYIYLVDMLDKNSYRLLKESYSDECFPIPNTTQRQCQFQDLIGSTPFGESNIYMIVSPNPLDMSASKGITVGNLSLEQQLRGSSIQAGWVAFGVYPN